MSNKFNAKITTFNGEKFASKKEALFYSKLLLQKHATGKDKVIEIELQPRFDIEINGKYICFYKADFRVKYADGVVEVFDVKGLKKGSAYALFKLKKKLVEAKYNIEIIEK